MNNRAQDFSSSGIFTQIKWVFEDNSKTFLLFSHLKQICCDSSLELSCWDGSRKSTEESS